MKNGSGGQELAKYRGFLLGRPGGVPWGWLNISTSTVGLLAVSQSAMQGRYIYVITRFCVKSVSVLVKEGIVGQQRYANHPHPCPDAYGA